MPFPAEFSNATWTAVDNYHDEIYITKDEACFDAANDASQAAGHPPHNVTATQGKFLQIICQMIKAKRVLEIGTLGGYSSIWFAQAVGADGQVVTIEVDPERAELAQKNITKAGAQNVVEIKVGKGLDVLPTLPTDHLYDVVFIDADKINNQHYYEWALKLTHPGSVIIVDNVVRGGHVIDPTTNELSVQGVRAFNQKVANDHRVTASALQTVGAKGYDGFAILLVK
ncbi:O-methyltransferase-domain-containing protein [Absidia repens]|uniref:O-methyltransferase-domain-containing protein n=1 Tax=Absidia repens TaxID=90262 RepID=A0A1X2HYS1_9FUNG|nr:O-methyltransferase-domain-containing protein [Absidia repens]